LTGKQKIHVFVTAQTAIYHCTIASYHCTFCVSLHTILCPAPVRPLGVVNAACGGHRYCWRSAFSENRYIERMYIIYT